MPYLEGNKYSIYIKHSNRQHIEVYETSVYYSIGSDNIPSVKLPLDEEYSLKLYSLCKLKIEQHSIDVVNRALKQFMEL